MSIILHSSRRGLANLGRYTTATSSTTTRSRPSLQKTRHASRVAARIPFTPPPFPVIEACPSPTCQCREMPAGLEIEREQSLNGSMAAYAEQVLISTGKPDWTSKIEEEGDAVFLRQMKKFLGRGGKYSDPFHNVLLTNSSLVPTPAPSTPPSATTTTPITAADETTLPDETTQPTASAFLLPSFTYIPHIPTSTPSIESFIKAFILPSKLHTHHDALSRSERNILLREPETRRHFPGVRPVDEILVLVCGHGGRDQRCGILGPILVEEFEEKLERQNILVLKDAPAADDGDVETSLKEDQDGRSGAVTKARDGVTLKARVATISHIGGHKFAGNVIVYIPPSFTTNALAGKGIWYGRVEPAHVEGIVAKTILEGKVIKEHFRGGIGAGGEVLRL